MTCNVDSMLPGFTYKCKNELFSPGVITCKNENGINLVYRSINYFKTDVDKD